MRWRRKAAPIALIGSPTNEKHSPPHLRDPVLSCQQLSTFYRISGLSEGFADFLEESTLAERCQSGNVLNYHTPGLQFGGEAQEFSKETIAGVPNFPLTNDAEALAGWTANQKIQLTTLEVRCTENVNSAKLLYALSRKRNAREISSVSKRTRFVVVRAKNDVEAGVSESERNAAGSRK